MTARELIQKRICDALDDERRERDRHPKRPTHAAILAKGQAQGLALALVYMEQEKTSYFSGANRYLRQCS